MNRKSIIQLLVAICLFAAAGAYLASKKIIFKNGLPWPKRQEVKKKDIYAKPQQVADVGSDALFPLKKNASLLENSPPIPGGYRPPVVYFAPLYGESDQYSSASLAFNRLLRFQLRAGTPERVPLNLMPEIYMSQPYRTADGRGMDKLRRPEEYLRDANSFGSDIFIYGRVLDDGQKITVHLGMTDLSTSKSDTWSSTVPRDQIAGILKEAAEKCAIFSGISKRDVSEAGIDSHLPNTAVWDAYVAGVSEWKELDFYSAINQNPDCAILYEDALQVAGSISLGNQGLKRFPEDPRLMRAKMRALRWSEDGFTAGLFLSELLRRYPENLLITHNIGDIIDYCFPEREGSAESPPQAFIAMVQSAANVAEHYPHNWCVRWDAAAACKRVSSFINTAYHFKEKPDDMRRTEWQYREKALAHFNKAVVRGNECPMLLSEHLRMMTPWFTNSLERLKPLVDKIIALDPSNYEAEGSLAWSQMVANANTGQFLPLITKAIERHADNPHAMARYGYMLGKDLNTQKSWGLIPEETAYTEGPQADLFIYCTQRAIDGGVQVDNWMAGHLRHAYSQRGEHEKAQRLIDGGKHASLTYQSAKKAMVESDWQRCLDLSRRALKNAQPTDLRHWLSYQVVKSLWKLGRHEESMEESVIAMGEFPHRPTFHYMFAVVALEKGIRLEEAYHHAKIAVPMDPSNEGARQTYERLAEKLGKPVEKL